jgi:hypothetical protein
LACSAPTGCVSGSEIVDGQVASADIANGTITGGDILNEAIQGADIQDNTITGADINETLTIDSPGLLDLRNAGTSTSNQVRLSNNGVEGSSYIYFFEGGVWSETLSWQDADNRFQFSDDLNVVGTVTVSTLGAAGATALCRNASNQIATCSSSARYKEDIGALAIDGEKLLALRPVEFKWKDSGEPGVGLVAEEVAELIPELVTYNDEAEVEGVNYDGLTVYLLDLVKRHEREISELRAASNDNSGSPVAASSGLDTGDLVILFAAAVGATAVISASTTLVVVRVVRRRAS